jgi:glucokinase
VKPFYLGVEIGASKLRILLGDGNGTVLGARQGAVVLAGGAAGILGWMKANVPPLLAEAAELDGRVRAIGAGFGGIIESATGRSLVSVQVSGWKDFNLKDWFEGAFALPCVVLNDTVAGGIGESFLGSGKGSEIFFYTNIGSGIGGTLIIRGRDYDGLGYGAAYFGHTYVPDWTSARPGFARKVEDLCSGFAIERRLRAEGYVPAGSALMKLGGGVRGALTCAMLGEAARAGDEFASAEVGRIAGSFATGLANVITLFSPDRVSIGGGVAKMGEVLLGPIRARVEELAFISTKGRFEIVAGRLGDDAVPIGAILSAARRTAP